MARLVRYDARGHGESPPGDPPDDPDEYRWDRLAADQLALADALGFDRYVVGGASMGAATALTVATSAPERIDALVLAIPPTAWEGRELQGQLYAAGADVVEQQGVEVFEKLAHLAPAPDVFADDPERWRLTPDVAAGVLPAVLRGAARSDLPPPTELRSITRPTLILAWTGDAVHPRSTAETLARELPRATLHLASTLDDLASWSGLVREFLAGLS